MGIGVSLLRVPGSSLSVPSLRRYTLMHLPEGHSFTGTMRKTEAGWATVAGASRLCYILSI